MELLVHKQTESKVSPGQAVLASSLVGLGPLYAPAKNMVGPALDILSSLQAA